MYAIRLVNIGVLAAILALGGPAFAQDLFDDAGSAEKKPPADDADDADDDGDEGDDDADDGDGDDEGDDDDSDVIAKSGTADGMDRDVVEPGLIAPSVGGLTGLFRTISTDIGGRHSFRIGLATEMFSASGFLVADDTNSRFIGTLSASYTPWRLIELFLNVRSSANSNDRTIPAGRTRLDQEVILALGDLEFGGKFKYPITEYLEAGAALGIQFLNSVGGVSISGESTGLFIGAIGSFSAAPLAGSKVPLRAHVNIGFKLDNSNSLASLDTYTNPPTPEDANTYLAALQVEKFALGMNQSRMQFRIALDFALRQWVGFGLTPIVEFAIDVATGSSDTDFDNANFIKQGPQDTLRPLESSQIDGVTTAWMTVGARVNPVRGFNFTIGSDIGIQSPGYGFGPPVTPWNLILGFSYAYDPKPYVQTVTREKLKTVVKEIDRTPPQGKIRGRIVSSKTLEPVEGAIVTFPGRDLTGLSSDPDGSFLTYGFAPGKVPVMVRHPDYLPGKTSTMVVLNQEVALEVKLKPAPPKTGKISGSITSRAGGPAQGDVFVTGTAAKQLKADISGNFTVELKPGEYKLTVKADGHFDSSRKVKLIAGATSTLSFELGKRPRRPTVRVSRRSLRLRRGIVFASGTATINQKSFMTLDEIADILNNQKPDLRLEIGAHLDRGRVAITQQQADAVKAYLVRAGVDGSRLEAKGYGSKKKIAPNFTPRGRLKNRRVEFKVLK